MKNWTKNVCVVLLGVCCLLVVSSQAEQKCRAVKGGLKNPFGAMNTCVDKPKHPIRQDQADMLEKLGFDGYGDSGANAKDLKKTIEELEKRGMKLFNTYVGVDIDPGKKVPNFRPALKVLKGSGAMLWVNVNSRKYKPSDPAGDAHAVEILRGVADMAHEYGVKIALYPHFRSWVESVEDAIRLTKKVNRRNLGVTINLCHWIRIDDEENMRPLMKKAMPYLFMVSICGADSGCKGKDWDVLLQRLDKGTFSVYNFVKTLDELGYTGPILVQGYKVKSTTYEILKASIDTWRKFSARLAAERN